MQLPRAIDNLIKALGRLPGIGPKTASRLAFYLLNVPEAVAGELALAIGNVKKNTKVCRICFGVSETEVCGVCGDSRRNQRIICVVERMVDVLALENVGGYVGVYHVLGGVINPLEHVGPEDLKIGELILRITKITNSNNQLENDQNIEIILATNPTMEGEATALYIKKQVESLPNIKVTRIGSGLPMGGDLEYADLATLAHAMAGRQVM